MVLSRSARWSGLGRFHVKAIGYVRVSTDAQAQSQLGLEAQRAALLDCAKRLGCELGPLHEDAGVDGGLPLADRPGLLDAVSAVRPGDVLIVAKRDRLGRDVVNVALVEREVTRRGGKIVSAAGEGSELEGPTGDLVRTILDAVNAFEKAQIALRTRAALRAKKARGERAGNVPFGFRATKDGKLEPDERESTIAATVRKLRRDGLTLRRIVTELRAQGVTGRTGQPLTLKRVHALAKVT